MEQLKVATSLRTQLIDITEDIKQIVSRSRVKDGILTLNKLIPFEGKYRHLEGNAPAHIKASIVGNSLALQIEDGDLALGSWQAVYLCEFDGPRHRKVWVKIVADKGK